METISIIFALSIFIVIYGGLHYYLFRKLRTVLPAHKKTLIITLSIFAASVFIVEMMTHMEAAPFITPFAWTSFFWMGLVALFFGISLPIDFLCWLVQRGNPKFGQIIGKHLSPASRTVFIGLFVLILAIYGTFSAQEINVRQVTLQSKKISRPITMVQITDLHVGGLTQEKHVQRIVNTINDLDVDIIVSTGDLIDMSTDHSEIFLSKLATLQSKLGKFAVYGNHETFVGLEKSRKLTEHAGFQLLSNNGVTLGGIINLFGVDDPSVAGRMQPGAAQPTEPIAAFSNSNFTVLLKHQPVVAPNSLSTFDLQLSGHVHGGQIYPFGLLTRLFYRAPMGLSRIAEETWLYVSYGTGTWGPPMRILAPPEITLFHLRPSARVRR